MNKKLVLAVDLDGVILDFDFKKWLDSGKTWFGEPKIGVKKALSGFIKKGYEVLVHTSREDIHLVQQLLLKYKIPHSYIWVGLGKPRADFYIDDRAILFTTWNDVINEIKRRSKDAFLEYKYCGENIDEGENK